MTDAVQFGLIGHPISHSGSPALFRTAYGGRYRYDLIEGEYFEQSFRKFIKSYKAVNVTAPFKELAFEKADIVSGPCALIGAANILIKSQDGVFCHNSDFSGVILSIADTLFPGLVASCYFNYGSEAHIKIHQAVREALPDCYGYKPSALVIGCGGAAKAAAVAAAEMGYSVRVANRSFEKAEKFVKGLPEYRMQAIRMEDVSGSLVSATDLVIYAIPKACNWLPDIRTENLISHGVPKLVLEANYKDPVLPELWGDTIEASGAVYISGRRWLLFQAVSGYSLMTGEVPDIAAMMSE